MEHSCPPSLGSQSPQWTVQDYRRLLFDSAHPKLGLPAGISIRQGNDKFI
jgi:hypothetical protein